MEVLHFVIVDNYTLTVVAEGYTSISVREPLSNIRAQSAKILQPHYATVSDDSGKNFFFNLVDMSVVLMSSLAQDLGGVM